MTDHGIYVGESGGKSEFLVRLNPGLSTGAVAVDEDVVYVKNESVHESVRSVLFCAEIPSAKTSGFPSLSPSVV